MNWLHPLAALPPVLISPFVNEHLAFSDLHGLVTLNGYLFVAAAIYTVRRELVALWRRVDARARLSRSWTADMAARSLAGARARADPR